MHPRMACAVSRTRIVQAGARMRSARAMSQMITTSRVASHPLLRCLGMETKPKGCGRIIVAVVFVVRSIAGFFYARLPSAASLRSRALRVLAGMSWVAIGFVGPPFNNHGWWSEAARGRTR